MVSHAHEFARTPARGRAGRRRPVWPLRIAQVYLVLLCLLWAATRLLAEQQWLTNLLLYFPQVAYAAPAALTLPLAVATRNGRAVLVNLLALGMVAGPLMGFNIPLGTGPETGRGGSARVRVMAYNIQGALEGFDLISEQVARFEPDVVIFSEARGWGRDRKIRAQLADEFRGWSWLQGGDVYIASRWPMISQDKAPLMRSGDREKVRAEVEAPFGRFHVVGVHFYTAVRGESLVRRRRQLPDYLRSTAEVRRHQTDDLLDWTAKLKGPVILAGDFNTPPSGRIYGSLRQRYADAFQNRGWGWGYTYPARLPLLRIDHIFHTSDWRTVDAAVGARAGSDHRPVFAELELASGKGG